MTIHAALAQTRSVFVASRRRQTGSRRAFAAGTAVALAVKVREVESCFRCRSDVRTVPACCLWPLTSSSSRTGLRKREMASSTSWGCGHQPCRPLARHSPGRTPRAIGASSRGSVSTPCPTTPLAEDGDAHSWPSLKHECVAPCGMRSQSPWESNWKEQCF